MNQEVIALSQDDLGVQGHVLAGDKDGAQIWSGPLANGDLAVIFFNRANNSINITLGFAEHLGLNPLTTLTVRDLVSHTDLGTFQSQYSAVVASHASQTLRMTISSSARHGKWHTALTGGRVYHSIDEVYDAHPNTVAVFGGRRLHA